MKSVRRFGGKSMCENCFCRKLNCMDTVVETNRRRTRLNYLIFMIYNDFDQTPPRERQFKFYCFIVSSRQVEIIVRVTCKFNFYVVFKFR